MAGREDERTLRMKEEYVSLFDAGMAPREIAEKFGLSDKTMYRHVEAIALANGRTHDSLLRYPHKKPSSYQYTPPEIPKADVAAFRKHFKQLKKSIAAFRGDIIGAIELYGNYPNEIEEGEALW